MPPIPYTDAVEQLQPDEDEHIRRCIDSLLRTNAMTFDLHRHGYRATHAKSHGVLRGTLQVHRDLPAELAQGLFATPGEYDAVARIATETGQLDDDRQPNARGFSLKVFDVRGETLHPSDPDHRVHDLLFNTLPVLPPGTAKKFMEITEIRERHFSEPEKIDEEVAQRPDAHELGAFGRLANIHPLAHAYYTQGVFRHGDYVAKIGLYPGTPEQEGLASREIGDDDSRGVLQSLVEEWTSTRDTVFDVRVQLRTDADAMPVEDAAVDWPQDLSPYVTVATLRFRPQHAYSPQRRVFADDRLAFRPWHGLAAHRPLGSVNRLRRRAYQELGAQRGDMNAVAVTEMRSASELPD
ncbi:MULTISPECIES: catalase family protein [unclassified Pseudonocardia]|uniref:catalase family protein n=1 Tax=unclassified Pseudonocardia TaxID=2619320 RepID=UPI001CF6D809|nr:MULTISPECIES: catalase family protein [unclassified Pseudonocardia]